MNHGQHTITDTTRIGDRFAQATGLITSIGMIVLLSGCGPSGSDTVASSAPRTPPYVVQKGCEFTLHISEYNNTSTTIDKGNTMVTLTLSMGDYRVEVSDCRVVGNPQSLPVYQD